MGDQPEVAALISKLEASRDQATFDVRKETSYQHLNQQQLKEISQSSIDRGLDNDNIIQLFPDIELAIQILVSSILSPKDMINSELIYKLKEPILPSEIALKMNTIVSSHFEGYHQVHEDLGTMLRSALFETGSYVKAVIPESTLDQIINSRNGQVSTESMADLIASDGVIKNYGFLGNAGGNSNRTALEAVHSGINSNYVPHATVKHNDQVISLEASYTVSDNFNLLKLPVLGQKERKSKIKDILKGSKRPSISTESNTPDKMTVTQVGSLLYKSPSAKMATFMAVPSTLNTKRKSIGRPLVLRFPSESVIPVYVPGDPSKHIGYFVLIDADGNPLSRVSRNEINGVIANSVGQNQNQQQGSSVMSMLMEKARSNLQGNNHVVTLDQVSKVYSNIVETDLVERLTNGIYGGNFKVSGNEEVYRIMLARSLQSKFTRLLYVPEELVSYFAFKYFENGVGKSYLDDLKNLMSMRAILLISKVMSAMKSSINITQIGVELDPRDPDPQKTIEIATHEVMKARASYFPMGINSPVDLVDWIQRAGIEMSFKGHPKIPSTSFTFDTKQMQHIMPDTELDDSLRKQTYMALGIPPELMDSGFDSEFATTVVSNNILLSKRVMYLQGIFTKQLTDCCGKIMTHDMVANSELVATIKENIALIEANFSEEDKVAYTENPESLIADLVERYIENLEIALPKPDTTTIDLQSKAFEDFSTALEKAIDPIINSEFMTADIVGDVATYTDALKKAWMAYFQREWMAREGYMPELSQIVTTGEDGKPALDLLSLVTGHSENLMRSSVKFMEKLSVMKTAANKDLEVITNGGGDPVEGGTTDEITGEPPIEGEDGSTGNGEPPVDGEEPAPTDDAEEVPAPDFKF